MMEGLLAQRGQSLFEGAVETAQERGSGKHKYLYIYRYTLTTQYPLGYASFVRSNPLSALGAQPAAHTRLLTQLQAAQWLCQGTVVCRPLRRKVAGRWVEKGPYYLWTGKLQGKTVCHALSKAQYELAKQAITANRRITDSLSKLQTITLQTILKKVPGVQRRK